MEKQQAKSTAKDKTKGKDKARRTTTRRRKVRKVVHKGIVHIKNTFNNTIVTVSDMNGNKLVSSSAGALNFKGSRKSTPYASQVVASSAVDEAIKLGLKEVEIEVKGPGYGRDSAIRAVAKKDLKINVIRDVTGLPHNGCRPKKIRRM
ncbi:30S ribosomal protein S11 [Spirochaetota bacterium]|nr:30S ribosomal protein S11 [Spirochaetota bacterium]